MELENAQITKTKSKIRSNEEQEVRLFLTGLERAIQSGNIEEMAAHYAKDIVAFDMMPPLQYLGSENFKKIQQECLTKVFKFPIEFRFSDLQVTAANNIGFCHCLVHFNGTTKQGVKMDNWCRSTICVEKIDGQWTVAHEHNSVPVDSTSGKALINLKPEISVH